MGRTTKPRKAYRPQPVHANAMQRSLQRCRKIAPDDVAGQVKIMATAVREFSAGMHCLHHWRSLADSSNVAESLAAAGICSGPAADHVIHTAQAALAAVHGRSQTRGTWTLYPAELEALNWLVALHARQLGECDLAEFDRAFEATHQRVSAARAGNAPRGAIVIVGDITAGAAA
jgi:hypothetical protein